MKKRQILEAWRNEEYYLSLSAEERAAIPEHPSGLIEDDILRSITGGCSTIHSYCGGNGETTNMCGGQTTGMCTPCPPVECY